MLLRSYGYLSMAKESDVRGGTNNIRSFCGRIQVLALRLVLDLNSSLAYIYTRFRIAANVCCLLDTVDSLSIF